MSDSIHIPGQNWIHNPKFKTGAKPTPAHRIAEAVSAGTLGIHAPDRAIPATVAMVPKTLSMLGNDQEGDCVTAESCAAIEAYSVYVGLPEIVITDSAAMAWAAAHGDSNGADLLSVSQDMAKDGVKDSAGTLRMMGGPSTVDYTNEATLQSAIAVGPVSIAIGSGDLPSGAGNANGWYALTSGGAANDHCVGLWGYGKAEDLFKALNLPCPSACAGKTGYLLYTWSTIGFVTHQWIVGTVQQALVRTPTVVGLSPIPPAPIPPTPVPVPGQFTPPFSLWINGMQVPFVTFPDVAGAVAMAQTIYNLGGLPVDVKDSLGALVQQIPVPVPPLPPIPPTPIPPGPVSGVDITLSGDLKAGVYEALPAGTRQKFAELAQLMATRGK